MKRMMILSLVGVLLFSLGFGGGMMAGRLWLTPEGSTPSNVEEPGPVFFVGDFIANLTGTGNHVANFKLSLETSGPKAFEMVASASWVARIRNEVVLLVKDRVFDELTTAEGIMKLAEDIKRTANSMMPTIKGKAPVVRVLFEGFILQ
ncbi:MAG: flagellar basal body-associated FliL family protein [Synergistaceae bacterium]|nr:flagellar basal body-associated FliL family protein [Synergistota bacterium]NLM70852.1 flagellar basal body-associated FliL family protein [Synergistaceae bacterium]